ncbi:MAG: Membrane-associated zinc metalloprotease [Candidatus Falkowbacteria bacterium GW2011_GWA2_39_24]|uniref:Zinc metalloprotease n=1 Tax=Candidatus Falkowbacteria bacterium GW2011_GWA2_39_24 TaxID=1618634 RepID=A0A0G0NIU6_9BACT|nr:MAG: Membrane-associated zinc metalloprotease [Candidatus Falkowbacteria bacterium GW2011_GWA2_39_24]
MLLTIIAFIAVLSILVFAHELGHFWTARRFGTKCEEFGFGYPPRACGFYKNNQQKWVWLWGKKEVSDASDTIYSINWIPVGGFVKIKGENGEGKTDVNSFAHKKIWQRALILSAGVIMNVILAGVLFSLGMMLGMPQMLDTVPKQATVSQPQIQIVQVLDKAPASGQLKMGDIIMSVDNQVFIKNQELIDYTASKVDQPIAYVIKRGGKEQTIVVTPQIIPETGKGGIGVAIAEVGIVKYPWYAALWYGFKTAIIMLWAIVLGLYELIKSLFTDQSLAGQVAGPVGIAALTGQMAHMGFVYLLNFTAILSLNLALINFLPLPALDGGRLLFLVIEKIKGKPVKQTTEALVHNIGFILLMLLVLIVTFKDVANLGCWTCKLKELFS